MTGEWGWGFLYYAHFDQNKHIQLLGLKHSCSFYPSVFESQAQGPDTTASPAYISTSGFLFKENG